MGTESMAQAWARDPLVQNGEIHRVKRGVAQTRQRRHADQAGVTIHHGTQHTGHNKYAQGTKQQGTGTHTVHHKAGRRLPYPRHHKKCGHQQAQLGIAQPKLDHEHGKQERQHQVRKVRAGMGQTNQANDGSVLPQRDGEGHVACGSGHVTMVKRATKAEVRQKDNN